MFCTKCRDLRPTIANELKLEEFRIEGNIRRIDCTVCKTFIGIIENNKMINLDEIVDRSVDGWKQVETNREHIIYYVLSQIVYPEIDTPREEELESLYDFADWCDHVFLRWLNGQPVGFYTIKPKEKYPQA
ncbi:uncharacterized protein LOC107046124 [Diachasma alloeum]|uniref:uncharacterized protein LOC107046124 n=1 Tax=Diachasma alloeum TaxID=454923 RepID=UPI0007382D7D|nr:uncharacterized protein LOC107046124 [Diachasma alloeum]